jgi:hypothetical protein
MRVASWKRTVCPVRVPPSTQEETLWLASIDSIWSS